MYERKEPSETVNFIFRRRLCRWVVISVVFYLKFGTAIHRAAIHFRIIKFFPWLIPTTLQFIFHPIA